MTSNEKDALLTYLEFDLLKFVEHFEQHVNPAVAAQMYDHAYGVVADMEQTLETNIELQECAKAKQPKK